MSLISPTALLEHIADPDLRIADVRWALAEPGRGALDYVAAHIPGAVFVDMNTDLVAPSGPGRHPLPEPAAFAARMEALGFDDASDIVVYDDASGTIAARLWWMLDDLGHTRVRVLDGGYPAWLAISGPVTPTVTRPAPGHLALRDSWTRVIDRGALTARLGSVALLDARAPERYRGDVEPIDPVAGHIPTARSLPTGGNLEPDGRFRSPEALRDRFGTLGDAVVTSCGSGITACHNALAMRVAGLHDPLLYPGSYSDWSRAGMAVVTGDEPGDPGEPPAQ